MIDASSITVVVPIYNGERYIADVVDSLEGQTLQEFHVLYVDDGSRDTAVDTIAARKRRRDRIIRKPNTGLYDTLNFAADRVETEWMAMLFQDDRVHPTWIERLSACVDPSIDCLWFAIDVIDEAGDVRSLGLNTHRVERIPPSVDAWLSALRRGTFWTISGSMVRTETVRTMRFRADLPHCGDWEFLLRGLRVATFNYVEDSQVAIRVHSATASAGNLASGRDLDERVAILSEQLSRPPMPLSRGVHARLAWQVALQAARRAAGAARRGHWARAASLLGKVPKAARLLKLAGVSSRPMLDA